MVSKWLWSLLTVLLFSVGAFCLFFGLGDFPLKDWDEAIYTEVAREILRTGDWLTLYYNHEYYFNKPPLYFWLSQFSIRWLGFNEFTGRLPSIVFALLTLLTTVGFGREVGGRLAGLLSGALLLSSAMFLENGSRHASPDSLLLLCSTAAVRAQYRARSGSISPLWAVGFLGAAIMTKGVAAAPLVVTMAALHLLCGDFKWWPPATYGWAVLLLTLLVLPWYLAQTLLHGMPFWQKHFVFMVWKRATQVGFLHSRGAWYYTRFLLGQFVYLWPLACVVVLAWSVELIRRRWKPLPWLTTHRTAILTLAVSAVTPVALFSLARNHTWWYILPSLPPICIIGGLGLAHALTVLNRGAAQRVLCGGFCLVLLWNMTVNVRTSLVGQIHNGIRAYGSIAALAKHMDRYAEELSPATVTLAASLALGQSATVATYVQRRVEFGQDYLQFLEAPQGMGKPVVLVIEKRKVLDALPAAVRVDLLEQTGDWALAVLRPAHL